jgi:hypothetical protein
MPDDEAQQTLMQVDDGGGGKSSSGINLPPGNTSNMKAWKVNANKQVFALPLETGGCNGKTIADMLHEEPPSKNPNKWVGKHVLCWGALEPNPHDPFRPIDEGVFYGVVHSAAVLGEKEGGTWNYETNPKPPEKSQQAKWRERPKFCPHVEVPTSQVAGNSLHPDLGTFKEYDGNQYDKSKACTHTGYCRCHPHNGFLHQIHSDKAPDIEWKKISKLQDLKAMTGTAGVRLNIMIKDVLWARQNPFIHQGDPHSQTPNKKTEHDVKAVVLKRLSRYARWKDVGDPFYHNNKKSMPKGAQIGQETNEDDWVKLFAGMQAAADLKDIPKNHLLAGVWDTAVMPCPSRGKMRKFMNMWYSNLASRNIFDYADNDTWYNILGEVKYELDQALGIGTPLENNHTDEDALSYGLGSIVSYQSEVRTGGRGDGDGGATEKPKKIVCEICDCASEDRAWEYWGIPVTNDSTMNPNNFAPQKLNPERIVRVLSDDETTHHLQQTWRPVKEFEDVLQSTDYYFTNSASGESGRWRML